MFRKIAFVVICALALALQAAPKVSLGVESQNVSVGEVFIFQIRVSDGENSQQPVFPETGDFRVRPLAPQRNSSTQVSIVNGKYSKTVVNDVIYQYQLSATRTGRLQIPSVIVEVDGQKYRTQQVPISVGEAEKIENIVLELSVGEAECYVGQPLVARWRLYVGGNYVNYIERILQSGNFDLPLLGDGEKFRILPFEDVIDQAKINTYVRVRNSMDVDIVGQVKNSTLNSVAAYCLEFSRPFTPQKPGQYELKAGVISCQVPNPRGKRQRNRNSFFDDFFDSMPMKNVAIDGNAVKLTVKPLPTQGQPADFSGIIGKCTLSAEAKPTEVNVGDPIVLTFKVAGLQYPDVARIPQFARQSALSGKFRVSDEDTGTVQDGCKVFQCTLRATNDSVTEIPPLAISYFDSASGQYAVASTDAIPLVVHAVKTVTAADAQGVVAAPAALEAPGGIEVKALDVGIAHNYSYADTLADRTAGFSTWDFRNRHALVCGISLLLYALLAFFSWLVKRSKSNPQLQEARRSASGALGAICGGKELNAAELYAELQKFLRARLGLGAGALTWSDVKEPLQRKGAGEELGKSLEKLFADFEAASYSGGTADVTALRTTARELAMALDKKLKR